jgi:hypothetical protein
MLRADDDRPLHVRIPFQHAEVPFYTFAEYTPQVAIRMAYAKATLENPGDWQALAPAHIPYEIDLVFTRYPRDLQTWRTNYFALLEDRLQALVAMDSVFLSPQIRWNMILQTDCVTEEDAKGFFHGFVIKYRPRRVKYLEEISTPEQLKMLITGSATTRDSTVIKVLNRHPEWDKMLVVMDWTGSMYKFGAQVVIWHKLHALADQSRVQHFVFFNDGNNKSTWQKKPGITGGVYRARSGALDELVSTMEYVMKKGNGGDIPENDLEAILTGTQYLDDFQEIILIADNKSDVRDMELLDKIKRPVHVILCDVRGEIHPHYVEIARRTGGSLHTLQADITKP